MSFRGARAAAAVLYCSFVGALWAQSPSGEPPAGGEPLPEPLTLEHALRFAEAAHPDIVQAKADLELARSERLDAEALKGLDARLRARARYYDPNSDADDSDAFDDDGDDLFVALSVRKPLYDFGRSESSLAAADAAIEGQRQHYLDTVNKRRIAIMSAFFDVLLADLEYLRDNEAMATEFVQLDRLQDRSELKQVSDLVVLEQETIYQKSRRKRRASEARQRATRARLAIALNRPGELPATLVSPADLMLDRELPDVEVLQDEVANNPLLRGLREQLDAARSRVEAARAMDNPVLIGEIDAGAYTRKLRSRDDFGIGVTLDVPLTTGGKTRAEVARRQAELHVMEGKLAAAQMEVGQEVLELWLELQTLQAQREEASTRFDYRELSLDRSRALYEMEVKTDLGDSMVRLSGAELAQAEADFRTTLAWAHLDALLGKQVFAPGQAGKPPGQTEERPAAEQAKGTAQ